MNTEIYDRVATLTSTAPILKWKLDIGQKTADPRIPRMCVISGTGVGLPRDIWGTVGDKVQTLCRYGDVLYKITQL